MITCIREVRRARGLTLQEVADRCAPPTTAQTIGRLETGTRTVSVGWLNRIAAALDVSADALVRLPDRETLSVAATVDASGAHALRHPMNASAPEPAPGTLAISITGSVGDYRAGDELWLDRLGPDQFRRALNRDVLVPRPAGRFVFGRMIGHDADRVQILPLGPGQRQQVIADVPWLGLATRLVRALG